MSSVGTPAADHARCGAPLAGRARARAALEDHRYYPHRFCPSPRRGQERRHIDHLAVVRLLAREFGSALGVLLALAWEYLT